MQAALSISPPVLPLNPSNSKNFSKSNVSPPKLLASSVPPRSRSSAIKAAASVAYETSTVDYSSVISVFPAEACETVGGEACLGDIYPEVKLEREARNEARIAAESTERDYLEYNDAKTVFCAEACDDLGGEFCGREYQRGVY